MHMSLLLSVITWVAPILWLLWIMLLETCVHKYVCESLLLILFNPFSQVSYWITMASLATYVRSPARTSVWGNCRNSLRREEQLRGWPTLVTEKHRKENHRKGGQYWVIHKFISTRKTLTENAQRRQGRWDGQESPELQARGRRWDLGAYPPAHTSHQGGQGTRDPLSLWSWEVGRRDSRGETTTLYSNEDILKTKILVPLIFKYSSYVLECLSHEPMT